MSNLHLEVKCRVKCELRSKMSLQNFGGQGFPPSRNTTKCDIFHQNGPNPRLHTQETQVADIISQFTLRKRTFSSHGAVLGPGGPIPHLETGLKEPQQKNLLKSNQCLILKLGNHVGYVNSPTRKGGSQIQNRTSADGYPDSLIKINEILDFDRFSDGP